MTLKRKKLRDAITFALVMGATSALVSGHAFAQDTATPATTSEEAEKTADLGVIVVTGSRIQSQSVTASSPVVEIQAEEFQFAGATRVDDLVNQYPQMSPYFDSFANNPSTGYPTIDLRGLGPNRTLVLVNGNRLAPGAAEVRDISMIPASLVKRVDILTGGASAVYGSDAIAGVVNFVLDTEFEGVSLSAGYGAYQHENDNDYMQEKLTNRNFSFPSGNSGLDGVSNNIDLAIGGSFAEGAGHAMAWLTWRKNDPLFQGERDYSSCALTAAGVDVLRANGTIRTHACGGSNTNAAGNFYVYQVDPVFQGTSASLNPNGSWRDSYGDPFNYAPPNYYQRPDERYTFGASVKYEINEHFKPYLETMFVNKVDALQIAPSGTFFADLFNFDCSDPLIGTLCSDLGFDPSEPIGMYIAKRNVEGGPRHQDSETSAFRVVAGLEGAINDNWAYNASFLYGHTSADTQGLNDFLSDRIVDAVLGCQPGSFSGCIPYDVFTPGGVTAEAANALAGVSLNKTTTVLKSFNAYVSGDLGFGFGSADGDNVSLVVGTEWREETYAFTADSHSQAGNFAGAGGPALPISGKISVTEFFMESAIPIIKDAGFVKSFGLDLGYRISDYNLSGQADTYKIGFAADFGMVRLRGGFNHAIRAPGTNELFATQQIALYAGSDYCAGPTPVQTAAQCANSGVTAARYGSISANSAGQYNQFIGGNPDLKPEAADTYTLGVVILPIDDLRITLDYYDIKLTDSITAIGADNILKYCGLTGDPTLCNLVNRNAVTGDLFRGNDPATAGHIVNLTNNFGEERHRGIDLGINYGWDMFGGRFSTSLQGTWMLEQEIAPLPGVNEDATYDCAGVINTVCQAPEWRHIANVRYSRDWFTVNLRWRYYGEMDYVDASTGVALSQDKLLCSTSGGTAAAFATCVGDGGLQAYNYFDLSASALIGEFGELTVGVNNIADKEPPLVGVNEALNGNSPGGYDQAGRFIFANFTLKF